MPPIPAELIKEAKEAFLDYHDDWMARSLIVSYDEHKGWNCWFGTVLWDPLSYDEFVIARKSDNPDLFEEFFDTCDPDLLDIDSFPIEKVRWRVARICPYVVQKAANWYAEYDEDGDFIEPIYIDIIRKDKMDENGCFFDLRFQSKEKNEDTINLSHDLPDDYVKDLHDNPRYIEYDFETQEIICEIFNTRKQKRKI